MDEEIKKLLQEHQEQTERYIGIIKEDSDQKFETIMEYVKDIPDIKERLTKVEEAVQEMPVINKRLDRIETTLDATFEKVGEVAIDVEVIKETVGTHSQEITQLKTR